MKNMFPFSCLIVMMLVTSCHDYSTFHFSSDIELENYEQTTYELSDFESKNILITYISQLSGHTETKE